MNSNSLQPRHSGRRFVKAVARGSLIVGYQHGHQVISHDTDDLQIPYLLAERIRIRKIAAD